MRLTIKKGDKYSNLTVIGEAEKVRLPSGQTNRMMLCKCDCGQEKVIRLLHLTRGRIRSCGCLSGHENHKMTNDPLYTVWRGMKNRCYCSSYRQHHLYADKGVTIIEEWKNSFTVFYNWSIANGWAPGLTIDRIDGNGNYEPDNCRFVTPLVNTCNLSTTIYVKHEGEKVSLRLLVHQKGRSKDYATIRVRVKRGWSAKRAIETPIREGNYVRGTKSNAIIQLYREKIKNDFL